MILGIILSIGDSITNMSKSGQDVRFKKYYLEEYSKNFSKIYLFSYKNEKISELPSNVILVPNKYELSRYLYAILMPFLNLNIFLKCDVFRVFHLLGVIPAVLSKIFLKKRFIFNYAYDYFSFSLIEKKYVQSLILKIIEPLALFFTDRVFVANENLFNRFRNNKKIVFLPNGVDVDFFSSKRLTNKNTSKTILSVGRLEKQKNYENLILALSGLKTKLILVGNGTLRNKLIKLADKKRVNLKLIEKVDNTKMPSVYNQADIFVLPSLKEGSPKVLFEAMSCGLPVVGSGVEGIKEVIIHEKNGILVKTDNLSIREGIKKILFNKKLSQKLGKRARIDAIKKFNFKALIAKEVKLIKYYD